MSKNYFDKFQMKFYRIYFFSHDSVDQIIACNSSTEIKGIKVRLEKTRTGKK